MGFECAALDHIIPRTKTSVVCAARGIETPAFDKLGGEVLQ